MNLPQAENIAVLVAGIVALSLALKSALGPTVMYVTEQLKSAYPVRDGAGGLVALTVSLVMSAMLAGLAGLLYATPRELPIYLAMGAFVGFFVSAGATESYKASALVNVDKSAAVAEVAGANAAEKALQEKEAALRAMAAKLQAAELARGANALPKGATVTTMTGNGPPTKATVTAGSPGTPATATVEVNGGIGKGFSEAA